MTYTDMIEKEVEDFKVLEEVGSGKFGICLVVYSKEDKETSTLKIFNIDNILRDNKSEEKIDYDDLDDDDKD
jgi:hypothetical protein